MLTAFDMVLILLAFLVMFRGFSGRWSVWRKGRDENRPGNWAGLFRYLLDHREILKVRGPGTAHLMVFWGFLVPLIVIILAQFPFRFRPFAAHILSLLTDVLGIGLLGGVLFFLVRRIGSADSRGPKRTLFPMCILLVVLFTGFLAEGLRIRITTPGIAWAWPFGWLLSFIMPASPVFMQVMIRIHFFSVLLLVAVLPFTFLRHVAAAPVNVFFRKQNPRAELRGISMDEGPIGAETYRDFTWKQLLDAEACVSCGRCEKNCPASISGKPLSPRKVIQDILEQAASGISAPRLSSLITEDEVWSCTTCMACLEHCPVYIEPMDRIIEMRRCQTMRKGMPPPEAGSLIRNLEIFGDVQGNGPARRADWAFDQGAPLFSSKNTAAEILLWVGCSGAFHPRYREVSRAMVKILKAAEVPFGILGKDERCCGDPARRMGEEGLFLELAKKNIEILKKFEIKKVVTLCPHCFNTLKNEYPPIEKQLAYPQNAAPEVVHAVEFIVELIEGGRIYPKYPLDKIIAIHDPCYLGRGNNIYEPQRKIVRSLPGTRLKELKRHHEKGFCCGGGGGGMWLHEHLGRRMNVIRAEEVLESRIELLGTACPYCLTMLDDGLKSLEPERLPEVMDVVEMVAASIG